MTEYVGNCNRLIDWNSVIQDIDSVDPAYIGPRHDLGDNVIGHDEVIVPLRGAGYKFKKENGNASWEMYFPQQQFSIDVVDIFTEFVGLQSWQSCWISKVEPGDVAPWHWDVTDDVDMSKEHLIKRFHCHIDLPKNGHVLIVEDKCFYNETQGNIYQWPSRKSWHAGANAGLEPKYLFNIWGI